MTGAIRAWAVLVLLTAVPARAELLPGQAPDLLPGAECMAAIRGAERAGGVPGGLMGSISLVESGRLDPRTGRVVPWPWTINVAGTGHMYETKAEAIAAVLAAQAAGVQSIDVGCMQINLLHHKLAFASLDEAFDPRANTAYAAVFLTRLFGQARSWPEAAASYHSATPGLREEYQRRVMLGWPDAERYGAIPAALPGSPAGRSSIRLAGDDTPERRAQLASSAADHARWAAMGLIPASPQARGPVARGSLARGLERGELQTRDTARRSQVRVASLRGAGGE